MDHSGLGDKWRREMAARGKHRGHDIVFIPDSNVWVYVDSGKKVGELKDRDCGYCGEPNTPEGHDGCLGTLPGVMNACCGHGNDKEAYVQFPDGTDIRGPLAIEFMFGNHRD